MQLRHYLRPGKFGALLDSTVTMSEPFFLPQIAEDITWISLGIDAADMDTVSEIRSEQIDCRGKCIGDSLKTPPVQ